MLKILAVFFSIGRRLYWIKINNPYLGFKCELNVKRLRPVLLGFVSISIREYLYFVMKSRSWCQVTPLPTHWRYYTLALSHRHTEVGCSTVYPKKYAHGFVVRCFVVVMQSFIMNSHKVFIHIHQGCFAGTGAIVRLPQCQWSEPDGYGKISQCITTTKHSKAKTVCIFLGIYCTSKPTRTQIWYKYVEPKQPTTQCCVDFTELQ